MTDRPCLPQRATENERALRARTLFAQREQYQWVHAPGQPPYCRGVPPDEVFDQAKRVRMQLTLANSVVDLFLARLRGIGARDDTVASFDRYYTLSKRPAVAARWASDEEVARQRLDGVNPILIRAISELPEGFPVTEDQLRCVLPSGSIVTALLGDGRVFLLDYEEIYGLPLVMGRFQVAPRALFWVDDSRRLMPLAIQLGQTPEEAPTVFTPADDYWLWRLACAHLQCADGTYHEIIAHLGRTHLFAETFWVAACRTLPAQHPLYVLLRPHFTGTIQINELARTRLIVPGGPIDESIAVGSEGALTLLARDYAKWSFEQFDPLQGLVARGVMDVERLPGYHYRDDTVLLYGIIRRYLDALLRIFYPDDDAVRQDDELQDWVRELAADAGGRVQGLPLVNGQLARFEDLHQILSVLIFVASCEHAAVNNGQYAQFGYIPNTPGAMYLPPPTTHDPRIEANFVYALPPFAAVAQQLTLVALLSESTPTPLGDYPDDFFLGVPEALAVVDRFRADLADAGVEIAARNAALSVPYWCMEPHRIGRSTAI